MLTHLKIQDVATVRECVLEPGSGLNVVTGEAGAGKSLVMEALALVLGGRASRDLVRSGADRAVVTAAFDVAGRPEVAAALEALGLADGDGTVVVKRELGCSGRHRVFVNGEPATTAMLSRLAPSLGEVHGQHESQRLLEPAFQRDLLDGHAGCRALVGEVRAAHEAHAAARARLAEEAPESERDRRLHALRRDLAEIEAAGLPPAPGPGGEDEDERVEREHELAARAEEVREAVAEAASAVQDGEASAGERVAQALRALAVPARLVPELAAASEALSRAQVELEECARALAAVDAEGTPGAAELARLEERLGLLERLKRRHGPGLDDVRAHARSAREELERWDDLVRRREETAAEAADAAARLSDRAARLSRARGAAAARMATAVREGLHGLDMPGARFEVSVGRRVDATSPVRIDGEPVSVGAHGADHVQFLFSANPGEEPKPLGRVASGGELARLMLVLHGLESGHGSAPGVLAFDEVDSGVGGRAALRLADRLAELAGGGAQVLCVTHLPQVAARAAVHHAVRKTRRGGRAETSARRLAREERLGELARMLSGRQTAAARRHAAELLESPAGAAP